MSDAVPSAYATTSVVTAANAVTVLRLLCTPILLVFVVDQGASWTTFLMGMAIALTDGLDGYLARRRGATSAAGAFLDPLADKVLVLGVLWALYANDRYGIVPVVLITARELFISVYRSYWGRRGVSIPARYWAKIKTVVQEFALAFALFPPTAGVLWLSDGVLWIAVVLTVVTGLQYVLDTSQFNRQAHMR